MNWFHDIADELPAPRDDEPSSLRQDIADELSDHLQSSFVRELHRTPEESSAKLHVLDRFGDPRRVARQLWFDAMKERIMSQRMNLVLSSLMTATCLGALGLMIVMLRDSREVNAAILERLQALAAPQPAPPPAVAPVQQAADTFKSMDWVPAKFRLVLNNEGGSPAAGFKVRLQSGGKDTPVLGETVVNGTVMNGMLEMTTGNDGIADLGLCRFGSYSLQIFSPWGEQLSRQFSLRPGPETVREIVCPAEAPEQVDVTFSVEWPDDLKDKDIWLICDFRSGSRRIGAETWSMSVPGFGNYGSVNNTSTRDVLIIKSDGKVAVQKAVHRRSGQQGAPGAAVEWFNFVASSRFVDQQQMPALRNRFSTLSVVRAGQGEGDEGVPVLESIPPGGMGMGSMGGGMMGGMGGGMFIGDPTSRAEDTLSFEPKPGQLNQWKIRIPEYVLDHVRIKLKLKPDPAAAGEPVQTF